MSNIDNEIRIYGRLGRDPEIKERQGNNGAFNVISLSVAVDRAFGDDVDWFKCEMSGKRIEVIQKYFHKGDLIRIAGSMESYKHDDKTFWYVRVSDFGFCGGGKASSTNEHEEPNPKDSFENIDEDVPF